MACVPTGMSKRSASKFASGSSSDAKEAKESQASTYSGDSNIVIETVPHDGGQQTVCVHLINMSASRMDCDLSPFYLII